MSAFPLTRTIVVAALAVLLAACASDGGPRAREAARLAELERYAGAPVEDFRFWKMDRWEGVGPETVAVWTRPNEAWLIRVRKPCSGLEFAQVIGLSSTLNRVTRAFDAVLFERQRCRIDEIRPIDVRAMKAARRGETRDG